MLVLASIASAYPVAISLNSPQGDFHTTVYKCESSVCSNLEYELDDLYGNPNNYEIPEQGSGKKYFAEYDYKECYLPKMFIVDTAPSVGYGPWSYTKVFSQANGCAARVVSLESSDSNPSIGDTITLTATVRSSHNLTSGPAAVPNKVRDFYSSDVDVHFYVNDQYVEQTDVKIKYNNDLEVEFDYTVDQVGPYNFSVWTKMDNDCKCTSSYWQHKYVYVDVDDYECTQDSDCDHLDEDFCSGDLLKQTEGVCVNYECEAETSTIENCNDYDNSECSGDNIITEDYTCLMAECTLFGSSTTYCDDDLFCNGDETCEAAQCVDGTSVDCSANDIEGVADCDYDSNPYTWEYREEFISECNEDLDECTTGDDSISSECSIFNCGADCESCGDCSDNSCEETYYDYCEQDGILIEYDGDHILDSTVVSSTCQNSCSDCECSDCYPDCSAPVEYEYCDIECGAECDFENDCEETECDYLDGCVGPDYYDYDDVFNSCDLNSCGCEQNSCSSPTIYENDPRCTQCQTDDDCDHLDEDLCENDMVVRKDGICLDYECTTISDEVEDCNDYDNQYCSGSQLIYEDYSCMDAECKVTGAGGFDCNDEFYCNGEETCENAQCISGPEIECSSNNKEGIATCDNDPDNNPYTWDYREEFISECDELTDSCTSSSSCEISHTCDSDLCDAECETDSDCGLQGSCNGCECEYDYYCGDGLVISPEQCEYPGTDDNYWCYQSKEQCFGPYLGVRDGYGDCNSVCGCQEDDFELMLIPGKCDVECVEDEDCDDDNPLTLDWCQDYQCHHKKTECDYNYVTDPKSKIHIDRIGFVHDEFVKAGEDLVVIVSFENQGYCEMKSTKIEAFIPWIPTKSRRLGPMSVDADGEITKDLIIEIPKDTPPGIYDMRLDIYNEGLRRTRHRPIFVY